MLENTYLSVEQMIAFIENADFETIDLEECGQVGLGKEWDLTKQDRKSVV